jgi:ribonucleoside-diphosphate reductase alpha chain
MSEQIPTRTRLPNRRPSLTQAVEVGGQVILVSVGFDPLDGRPREIFMDGARAGTDLAAILDDVSVVLSVAMQHGVEPAAMANSVSRLPAVPLAPPYLDQPGHAPGARPGSIVGAALDLVLELRREG